jgi:hypothetical protein
MAAKKRFTEEQIIAALKETDAGQKRPRSVEITMFQMPHYLKITNLGWRSHALPEEGIRAVL